MKIEALQTDDLALIPGLQPDGWQDILPAFRFYTNSSFCFPHKVVIDDRIIGLGSIILHGVVAWLGHIIVHHDFRRRGIGLAITNALVQSLNSTGCETIYLLATDMGTPVYEKAGFETETEYLFFKDLMTARTVTDHRILPYDSSYKEQLVSLDRAVSGEQRAFHLEEYLHSGFLYRQDGQVSGFYLPGFGDGLIIANNPTAGLLLIQKHLATNNRLVFPKDNLTVTHFLYNNGYKETNSGKRMRLGRKRDVNFQYIYNRIGGNLG